MSEIEKINRYIKKRESGEFPFGTKYQMNLSELLSLAHMDDATSAICMAFEYGRAKGYRAAKAEGRARA